MSKRLWKRLALVTAGLLALGSCRTVQFYTQAARGQWDMLHRARPIDQVLADQTSSDPLRRKLRLVQTLRTYAHETLHLPLDGQFANYADLERKHAVWVVFAAPADSVEAHTWWYPLVGRLKYRGFFTEAAAEAEAARLKAQGLDVHVGGTAAYSTLGWFSDPVLNTFIHRDDSELAELIFHELTHARVFIAGDTDFNEALATAFAEMGVKRWLRETHQLPKLQAYEQALTKDRQIVKLLLDTRAQLKIAFAHTTNPLTAKAAVFTRMKQHYTAIRDQWQGDSRYDRFFDKPMNNARLNTVATYYDLIPGFERILNETANEPDAFFKRMEALGKLSREDRRTSVETDPHP
jgi:predicted aminopeptidase